MSKQLIYEWLSGRSEEMQYIKLTDDILQHGTIEEGRNGNTKVIIGNYMYFTLNNGVIPLLTTKKVFSVHI